MKPVNINGKIRHKIYPAKIASVTRIVRKIVRGLCYKHDIILPPIHDDNIFVDILKYRVPEAFMDEMQHHHRDKDIVEYHYSVIDNPEIQSAWIITFFQTVTFIALVLNPVKSNA